VVEIPPQEGEVHLFKIDERRFAFDVASCSFLEIDQVIEEAIRLAPKVADPEELVARLSMRYDTGAARSASDELILLIRNQVLFTKDDLCHGEPPHADGVATLSVNVSQKCNLKCRYCFAEGGSYGLEPANMKAETATATLDFFFKNSNGYDELSLCFFGGEPLLNLGVMQKMVAAAHDRAHRAGKQIRFNVTTNGTLLSATTRKFLIDNGFGVIVSIDGDRNVHDAMRVFRNGRGSYTAVRRNLNALLSERGDDLTRWILRATFSRRHLNIGDHAFHLADFGFGGISVEPCLSKHDEIGIQQVDLPELKARYLQFARAYLRRLQEGDAFSFFHFWVMLDQARSGGRRMTQCGAGKGYLAVSCDGGLFPCHRLVGKDDLRIGDVWNGITFSDVVEQFRTAHVGNKPLCRQCWARYICGGGCHACAIHFNGDIKKPYELECELVKQRIEIGAYLYSVLSEDQILSDGESFTSDIYRQ